MKLIKIIIVSAIFIIANIATKDTVAAGVQSETFNNKPAALNFCSRSDIECYSIEYDGEFWSVLYMQIEISNPSPKDPDRSFDF